MAKSKVGISDCKNEKEGWIMTTWSNQQWTYLFRHKDRRIRAYIAAQATYAAKNNKIGYGVADRTSFWDNLLIAGLRAGNINNKCSADHASAVAALVRGAGTIMNDTQILSHVLPTMTARNAKDMLTKGGFSCTNDSQYVTSDKYLRAGDILWKVNHMCIVTGDGSDYEEDQGTNGLSQFLDSVKSHLGEDNAWTRAMMGKDALLPSQAWDAAYISACAKQNGLTGVAFVETTNPKTLIDGSVSKGYGEFINGPANGDSEATPKVGDVVGFTYKEGQKFSHVGVVTNVHKNDITVISGDLDNKVGSTIVKKTFKSIRGYYRPIWDAIGIPGGDYDPGDWMGESSADLYYDRSLALIREVGYIDDDGERSVDDGKYQLSVINYTQLLQLLMPEATSAGLGGIGQSFLGQGISDAELAQFTELGDVGGIQELLARSALAQVGKAYVYGSKGPDTFDCSGLVSYVYGLQGISIGAGTQGILDTGRLNNTVVMNNNNYNASNLAIGDLIVTSSSASQSGRHVVMYVGNGKVVSASGVKTGVVTRNVTTSASDILGVVRPLLGK